MIAYVLSYSDMAEHAQKIIERWRKYVPPEVPKEEVELVVSFYLSGSFRINIGTSHWIVIQDDDLRLAKENGITTGTQQGILTLSHSHGKKVKAWLVKKLLRAIEIKEQFRQLREEQSKTP